MACQVRSPWSVVRGPREAPARTRPTLDVTLNEALFAVRAWCDLAEASLSRRDFRQVASDARRAHEWYDVAVALASAD